VDDDLVDPGNEERDRERGALHELGPVSDDGEDLHGARRLLAVATRAPGCGEAGDRRS
jgi:hypothetical protein